MLTLFMHTFPCAFFLDDLVPVIEQSQDIEEETITEGGGYWEPFIESRVCEKGKSVVGRELLYRIHRVPKRMLTSSDQQCQDRRLQTCSNPFYIAFTIHGKPLLPM